MSDTQETQMPEVSVSVDGDEKFVDVVEPGYLARFDVDGKEVEIEVNYDDA